jgi:hypothetical protein
MSHPDPAICRSPWLSQALDRIRMLPKVIPIRPGVEGLAIQLLRSIEADDLPVPSIRVNAFREVLIAWDHHVRSVTIAVVGPDEFMYTLQHGGRVHPIRSVRRHRPEQMRRIIKWIFPAANAVSVRKGV